MSFSLQSATRNQRRNILAFEKGLQVMNFVFLASIDNWSFVEQFLSLLLLWTTRNWLRQQPQSRKNKKKSNILVPTQQTCFAWMLREQNSTGKSFFLEWTNFQNIVPASFRVNTQIHSMLSKTEFAVRFCTTFAPRKVGSPTPLLYVFAAQVEIQKL